MPLYEKLLRIVATVVISLAALFAGLEILIFIMMRIMV